MAIYAVRMLSEEQINDMLGAMLSDNLEKGFKNAEMFDELEESDAVMMYAVKLMESQPNRLMLAVHAAAVTIRWHRTRKLEATISSREPSPSPE